VDQTREQGTPTWPTVGDILKIKTFKMLRTEPKYEFAFVDIESSFAGHRI
jgi:hypothetical protein